MTVRKVGREVISSLILGGIPCFIAYYNSEVIGIKSYLKAIDASDTTVYYFIGLFLFHLAISLIGKWLPRNLKTVKNTLRFMYEVANEVGASLFCLYRIITGATLGCAIISIVSYPTLGEFKYSLIFILVALPFLSMCVFVSNAYNYAKDQQRA